jgi:hypothetical protein
MNRDTTDAEIMSIYEQAVELDDEVRRLMPMLAALRLIAKGPRALGIARIRSIREANDLARFLN